MFRGKGKAGGGSSKSKSGCQKVTVTKTRKMETPQEYIMKLRAALFEKDGTTDVRVYLSFEDTTIYFIHLTKHTHTHRKIRSQLLTHSAHSKRTVWISNSFS